MGCCKSEPDVLKIEFTNLMNSGCRHRKDAIHDLYDKIVEADRVDSVFSAVDEKQRTAFHLACENGHIYMLEWAIARWTFHEREMPLEVPDFNGYSPLISAC